MTAFARWLPEVAWFGLVAAGTFGVAAAVATGFGEGDSSRPLSQVAPDHVAPGRSEVAREQAPASARRAAAGENLGRLTESVPSRVPVPPLTALDRAAVHSAEASALRGALVQAINPYVFRSPGCLPADHPELTVAQFDLQVQSSRQEATVTGTRSLRVIDGPALDPKILDCFLSRVPEPLFVTPPSGTAFPEFQGDAAVRMFLSGTPGCKPDGQPPAASSDSL